MFIYNIDSRNIGCCNASITSPPRQRGESWKTYMVFSWRCLVHFASLTLHACLLVTFTFLPSIVLVGQVALGLARTHTVHIHI